MDWLWHALTAPDTGRWVGVSLLWFLIPFLFVIGKILLRKR